MHRWPEVRVIALTPGTVGLCALAINVFGANRLVASGWGTPVYVSTDGLSPDDLQAGIDLIQERGVEVCMPVKCTPTEI